MNFRRVLVSTGLACVLAFGVLADYSDDYVTIALGANATVTTNWVGNRLVYIFTNSASATASSTLTFNQNMTIEEMLIVGGGGAGGALKGAGGGGGGVIHDPSRQFCSASSTISITVGKGGIGTTTRSTAAKGDASGVTRGGTTLTAFGGGGGGSDAAGAAGKPTTGGGLGSGGGAGYNLSVYDVDGQDYTSPQGKPGGNSAGGVGGGGGYSERGKNGVTGQSGKGGEGYTNSMSGVEQVYGSGGGGGGGKPHSGTAERGLGGTNAGDGGLLAGGAGGDGVPGFGGGGGGGGYNGTTFRGGHGGSGTVILSFTVGGSASKPEISADDIDIVFTNGCTQPFINVTSRGAEGAAYTATLTVYCGTGALAQAGTSYESTNLYENVHNGDTVGGYAFVYPTAGDILYVKVVAVAEGVEDTVTYTTATVTGEVPAYVGKGGGASVIHVRVGATGKADGTSWTDAYTDFRAALQLLSAERPELWFCGTESAGSSASTVIAPPAAAAIRGGFAGTENSPVERVKGTYAKIDGKNTYNCLTLANPTNFVVDGFIFTRGSYRGLVKSGNGDLIVTNCVFDSNGLTKGTTAGRGLHVSGSSAVTHVTIVDCRIANHRESATEGAAGALYLTALKDATVSGCYFTSNGLALATAPYGNLDGRQGAWGVALAVSGVPVTVESCQFRGNVAPSMYINGVYGGGVVRLIGNCDGSVFRNCAFVGNASVYAKPATDDYTDPDGGALVVRMAAPEQTVRVENCTFALNLYSGRNSTAGINVYSGTVGVTNSIFFGNVCGTLRGVNPTDLRVQTNAIAKIGYTLFGGATNRLSNAGGTLVSGEGCFDANPLFVTTTNSVSSTINWGGAIYFKASADTAISDFNIHLRGGRGYVDETTGALVTDYQKGLSPAIDAGNRASAYSREPVMQTGWHGKRVNLGFYGNTPWATMTPYLGGTLLYLQ